MPPAWVKRFLLTGGHGVGKTSILLALEARGQHVVFEAAEAVQRVERARGNAFSDDDADFESRALALHVLREEAVNPVADRVFFDRGAADHLAYSRVGRWPLREAEKQICSEITYDAAFLIEPPPDRHHLDRVEHAFNQRLVAQVESLYTELGVPLWRIPYAPLVARVAEVLDVARGEVR